MLLPTQENSPVRRIARAFFFAIKETCAFLHKRLDIYLSFMYIITTHGDTNQLKEIEMKRDDLKKLTGNDLADALQDNVPTIIVPEDRRDEWNENLFSLVDHIEYDEDLRKEHTIETITDAIISVLPEEW